MRKMSKEAKAFQDFVMGCVYVIFGFSWLMILAGLVHSLWRLLA
jgi:hypothetical protein